jgi:hypothetical protein
MEAQRKEFGFTIFDKSAGTKKGGTNPPLKSAHVRYHLMEN